MSQNVYELSRLKREVVIYSYFEKRRKKSTKLHKPISKGSMGRLIELLHVLHTNEI